MTAAKKIISYLYRTRNYIIEYSGNNLCVQIFKALSNIIFINNTNSRKSSYGYLIQFFKGLIDWSAIKQKVVTTLNTEAKLLALLILAKKVIN